MTPKKYVRSCNKTLSNAGFDVIEAEDGDDALNKLTSTPVVDMLITDLNMPNIDGLELIRRIREDKVHSSLLIVILTTDSSEEKKRAGREAGASAWIDKPFKASSC